MNRLIEFRGKAKCSIEELNEAGFIHDNGWVYGSYVDGYIINGVVESTDEYIAIENWCPVKIKTVGQYTGLKDKNGKEIFEGDIVFAIATYDCANTVVVWDDGGFVLVPCKYYKNYISRCGYKDIRFLDKEVVGNIHDNPELLEVL